MAMPFKDPEVRRVYAREAARKWREANREKHRAYVRSWYVAHNRVAYMRAWRAANPKSSYTSQKSAAKQRGIPFLLTFEEWWDIWQASGKWEECGRKRGQYVMARYGDRGPYAIGNVRICTVAENCAERLLRQTGRPRKQSKPRPPTTEETRERMRESARRRWDRHKSGFQNR